MVSLFKTKGFSSYIMIMFLNAMTDLGHKIILQNTIFKSFEGSTLIILTALTNALIILPFILLYKPAGNISDRYKKTKVVKYSALFAIFITALITISYYIGAFWFAFFLTFILASQSAIYSPAKYGLIKEMFEEKLITKANSLVQSVTIISILLGAVVYSLFFESLLSSINSPNEILKQISPLGFLLILCSIFEYFLAIKLEKQADIKVTPTQSSDEKILPLLKQNPTIWQSIIALSIFWGVSQIVVAIFGEYLKSSLKETNTIISQGLLSLSGIGIVFGSLTAGVVSKNYTEKGIIPLGTLLMSISLLFIPFLNSLWSLGGSIFLFGYGAGLFIVPLNSLIQIEADEKNLGKILAGNNLVQNFIMFLALIVTAVFGYLSISSKELFFMLFLIMTITGVYAMKKLLFDFVRFILKLFINLRYKLHIDSKISLDSHRGGILLLGNHQSLLDWAILQVAYPRAIRFVMDKDYYNLWYIKPIVEFFNIIPISTRGSKEALKGVSEALNNGEVVCIFPEGHLTQNGLIGEFQKGFEVAIKDVKDAKIVPFYLRGLWESGFSKAPKKTQKNKDFSVSFGSFMDINSTKEDVKREVENLSVPAWQNYIKRQKSIQEMWIENSNSDFFIADSTGAKFSNKKFTAITLLMAKKLKAFLKDEKNIGIIMPSTIAGSLVNMAIFSLGKTVVNLNYSSGDDSLSYAIDLADINSIITSKQAITKLKAKGFDLEDVLKYKNIIYLEDLKPLITKFESVKMFLQILILPKIALKKLYITPRDMNDTAVILYSSGSEGRPKGIELTHKNIVGNIKQINSLIAPSDKDVILGTLPIFHSLGLTVTTLFPLLESIPVVCHPDPTDGYNIGKLAHKYKATMLFATSTFFRLYSRNKKLNPLMFETLRLAIAGAEKLQPQVREMFKEKFNLNIYEGYGATETSPVASINIPDKLRADTYKVQKGEKKGTIGKPLVGTSILITDPETFEPLSIGEEGMILIGGVQVMKGYLKNKEKTDEVLKVIDGITYYVTGDKGKLDEDGFLTIVDRYSRFAKIGGEMVSLGLVESSIKKICNESFDIAITALSDEKKGEKLVLLAEGDVEIESLKANILELGLNPLYLPSHYLKVDEIPKLGSGKADFKAIKKLASQII